MKKSHNFHQWITMLTVIGMMSLVAFVGVQKASAANKSKYPYFIKVNRVHNTITIYEQDEKGDYTVPVKAMACSVGAKGTETVLGSYQTKEKYRWKLLMGNVWGQYSTRIVGGILFHSVYYYKNGDPSTLATSQYNKLGSAASHGCIRLTVEDAKWIYDNCAIGTTVTIYDDKKSPGPLGKPETLKLPSSATWDPTDPSDKNPYKDKNPKITGAKNIKVNQGDEIDLLKGIAAKSTVGLDISSSIKIKGNVDSNNVGTYEITYSVVDALGRKASKNISITVVGKEENKIDQLPSQDTESEIVVIFDDRYNTCSFVFSGLDAYDTNRRRWKEEIKMIRNDLP